MLLIALMLADALSDARRDSGPQGAANGLDVLATRLEAVATALEQNGKSA